MFIRINDSQRLSLRASASLAAGIAVLLQLFAAGGLACSTMDMGDDAQAHPMGHVHGAEASSTMTGAEAPAPDDGACAMMMHCTAPALVLHAVELDADAAVRTEDAQRALAHLPSASSRTTVPPPRT